MKRPPVLQQRFERFHEFCIEVLLEGTKSSPEDFRSTWKSLKLSERQLGAFLILYLSQVGSTSPWKEMIDDNFTKFRNNIIHNGYIPSSEETMKYAKARSGKNGSLPIPTREYSNS